MEQNKTRWGLYKNLEESPFFVKYGDKIFRFHSISKLRKFKKDLNIELTSLMKKYKLELTLDEQEWILQRLASKLYRG